MDFNKNDKPLVSIVMPTYKRSAFLERAIDSLLKQDYEYIEIIVVDDNDPLSEYRKETEKKMLIYKNTEKVCYIKNDKNIGGALARNNGIKNSNGSFITFLDDDDIYLNDKISTQVKFMKEYGYDMSFTDLRLHNNENKLVDYREYSFIKSFDKKRLMRYHLTQHITGTPTFMFKKEYLEQIGGFSEIKMGQEFFLMLKTIESNGSIGYLPGSQVIAYLHKNERISIGKNKYQGEKVLLELKKKYFEVLTLREKIYVYFRHHAVIAVTGIRSKDYKIFLTHIFLGFVISPIDTLVEVTKFFKKAIRFS